jgi:hypothetical protein
MLELRICQNQKKLKVHAEQFFNDVHIGLNIGLNGLLFITYWIVHYI